MTRQSPAETSTVTDKHPLQRAKPLEGPHVTTPATTQELIADVLLSHLPNDDDAYTAADALIRDPAITVRRRVSASVCVVGVLAEALAEHRPVGFGKCHCGWFTVTELGLSWREKHEAHVASVVAALPNIAIIELPEPEPDETVHPYWAVEDVSGLQVVRTTDSDGSVEGDWVNIEFTARWRTVDRETAQALGAALLAAARAAGGQA